MSEHDRSDWGEHESDGSDEDPIEAESTEGTVSEQNPLADLSPFADGDEGTNIDDDSDWELEDTEYQDDADRVYEELLERVGEQAPQPRLDATRRVMELLGDPQRSYPMIHITGTNGKTSTSRMIESILRAYGLRTGLMTSPHLSRVNERIVVDGVPISNRTLAANWADIRPFLDMVDAELIANSAEPLTYFEALTALAFATFADAPVDVAVVEVGMGGEWDSTNVADGQVAVFTPIALDHTQRLGTTVREIARTKSGIIKPLARVVSAAQDSEALAELERAAELTEANLALEGSTFELTSSSVAVGGQMISVRGLAGTYPDLFLPMFGDHQGHNAAVAIAAVESFLGSGSQGLVGDILAEGLATASSPGRLQIIGTEPTVIVDAAHNPHGAAALAAAIRDYFSFDEVAVVVGVLNDKDARGVIAALDGVADRFYATQSRSERAVDRAELGDLVADVARDAIVSTFDDLESAVGEARRWASEGARRAVVVTGSITIVGEAIDLAVSESWMP